MPSVPRFIPGPWSLCSATCGAGTQIRKVKCQVLLSFSQSVEDLPDDECEGTKPQTEQGCYSGPCNSEMGDYDRAENLNELHAWEYKGFTECSESCAGGVQEAIVVCLNKQTRERTDESLCSLQARPPQLVKVCKLTPCPPRWEIGKWSACSSSCGVGLQTRDVFCMNLLSHETNETATLEDKNCPWSKPGNVQACNHINCPPDWHSEEWQQCSQSCGRGVQIRWISCKQRMADGSFRYQPEEFCLTPKPDSRQLCVSIDCPTQWLPSKWSQCSSTCGEGTQRRDVVCKKMGHGGISITLNASDCSSLSRPPLLQPCFAMPCATPGVTRNEKKLYQQGPRILGLRKIYVQLRKERKLQFNIGGQAYLLPKTAVLLRCPVRRFRKSMIMWEKDGKHLSSSPHVTITHFGYIKINQLKAINVGTYTCVAGPARDNFVIKIIGFNNKLAESSSSRQEEGIGIANEALSSKDKHAPGVRWNKTDKSRFFIYPNAQYDGIILKILELKGWSQENLDSRESHESREKDAASVEDASAESIVPQTFVIDQERLDEIIRAISRQSDDLKDIYATHVISQLIAEISKVQPDANKSKLKFSEKSKSTSSVESSFHKLTTDDHRLPKLSSVKLTSSKESIHTSTDLLKAPIIRQKTNGKVLVSSTELIAEIGRTVLLTSWTRSLTLKCEAEGNPKPLISWTKNGQSLKYSKRIKILPDKALKIYDPNESDVGVYNCTATSPIGLDSRSTNVAVTEKPIIRMSKHDLVNINSTSVSVDVGSVVIARLGANITIKCQVNGVPKPSVTWTKEQAPLGSNVQFLQDGSLSIIKAAPVNQGLYSCSVLNAQGQATAATNLILHDPPRAFPEFKNLMLKLAVTGYDIHTVLASRPGTKELLSTGSNVLIGCPVKGFPKPGISWLHNGKPISMGLGPGQALALQQILQIPNITKGLQGDYSCRAQNEAGTLTLKVTVEIAEYEWLFGGFLPCSAPCGNKGLKFPKLKCLRDNGTEVDKYYCKGKTHPDIQPIECNVRDCPPRWTVTSWSPCSQLCGRGIRKRLVSCQKVTAGGMLIDLSPGFCAQSGKKPVDSQTCEKQLCSQWVTSIWSQCNGLCVGMRLGTQHRHVVCQAQNGTRLPSPQCSGSTRPISTRNCTSDVCTVQWQSSSWTPCTSSCGNHGFQSRRVKCVHRRTNRQTREQFCWWKQRPVNWQRCNIMPCEKLDCRDTTRYCEMVKQLRLCVLPQYKLRCCESCNGI
ncbi:ADAMTS-like protein 1 [Narcine bancroftii]|uniref:ADAMTS-like protein 1 n=1 Tax=Narcine bancroftii TaxID=1343680 RepID=UPI00383123CB